MFKTLLGLFIFILSHNCQASNQVKGKVGYTVTPLAVNLSKPGDYADIVVNNGQDYPLYIQHRFVKITKLENGQEKRTPIEDYSLIASPDKVVVKPKSNNVIRISVVKPLSKNESYGFLISPLERKLMKGHSKKNGMKMVLQCIIEYMVRIKTGS